MYKPDIVFVDIATTLLTGREFIDLAYRLVEEHPELEIILDGDAYALVGRHRN